MSDKLYCVVWERKGNVARIYDRKLSAIYDHVRFRAKHRVWFLEGLTAEQVKERLRGVKVKYIRRENHC